MYGSLDISVSGMIVARTRMEVAHANLTAASADALRDSSGRLNPYQRRTALVASGDPAARNRFARELGVHVAEIALDRTPVQPKRYDPDHPDAFPNGPYKGYIAEININPVTEQINSNLALRAYEANAQAADVVKQMINTALRLIA